MAINLNPGADASLVSAAYKAGTGTTPGDYSGALESMAKGYEKTMQAQTDTWKNIGKIAGIIGADMVANANEAIDARIKAGGLNPESAAFLIDGLDTNKQAQKDLGLLPGILGDKETRQRKRELKLEQAELFAEIDMAVESINAGADAVAAGTYDARLYKEDAEMVNAIIKSNLKNPITEAGNQAVLGRDENTGELMFTLKDSQGNSFDPPKTMTVKQFNNSIATNVKDTKNLVGNSFSSIETQIANAAVKSKSGVIDEQMLQVSLNQLESVLQKDVDIKRAMLATYGMQGTSFADDLNSVGAMSAKTFSSLVQALGSTKDGQLVAEGAFEGIADTDNIPGLSQEEINVAYGVYADNILKMKDPLASKAAFKNAFADRMREAHKYGYSKRTIETNDGANKFGLDADTRYYTMGADQNYARIYGRDIENAVETFKSIQDKGSGIFTGYDKVPHKLKNGKWFTYNDETGEIDKPSNALSIFTSLGWNNNQKIMDYLKIKKLVDHDNLSPTPLQFLNTDFSNKIKN